MAIDRIAFSIFSYKRSNMARYLLRPMGRN